MPTYDESCSHGGRYGTEPVAAELLQVIPDLCDVCGGSDPAVLQNLLERRAISGGADIALALAVDAFGNNDIQNAQLLFRVALAMACTGTHDLEAARRVGEDLSGAALKQKLSDRIPCLCLGHDALPTPPADAAWNREKSTATVFFREGQFRRAAISYVEAAEALRVSAQCREEDGGAERVLFATVAGRSVVELRALSLQMVFIENNISLCLLKCGNADLALQAAEESIKVVPSIAKSWARKGAALTAQGRHAEAASSFDHAAALAAEREDHLEVSEFQALARKARMLSDVR